MRAWVASLLAALAVSTAGTVLAEAPATSIRPVLRGEVAAPLRPRPAPRVPVIVAEEPVAQVLGAGSVAFGARVGAEARIITGIAAMSADRSMPGERVSTSGVLVSPRPPPRAVSLRQVEPAVVAPGALPPRPRPAAFVRPRNPARNVTVVQPPSVLAVLRSPRPEARPENHQRRAVVRASGMVPTQPGTSAIIGQRGAVCGDPRIQGQTIAPIVGRIRGCGLEDAVRITEVDGVRLSSAATIDCTTARALTDWVAETVKPTVGRHGGGVASLQVFAHYSCRTRNNQAGARVSEHGRGRAIDIGAINLKNGASISVLDHWRADDLGRLLKAMHRGACGTFGTVLGPQSDRYHQNHFHLDTARYRSRAYCR